MNLSHHELLGVHLGTTTGARTFLSAASFPKHLCGRHLEYARCCGQECPRSDSVVVPRCTQLLGTFLASCLLIGTARADVTLFSEDFEGSFPNQWAVGSVLPDGQSATWGAVNSAFGGVSTRGGQAKAFCAATAVNYTTAVVDFSGSTIQFDEDATANVSVLTNSLIYRADGSAWAINHIGGNPLVIKFTPVFTGPHQLRLVHLSSANSSGCTGGGYSPVTISANGTNIAACYDPAANNGGVHTFVTNVFSFNATNGIEVTLTWSFCADACSQYWIQRAELVGPGPEYQNQMSGFMQRSLDLTGCTNATLRFWHVLPSIHTGYDFGRVLIDDTEIWRTSSAVSSWASVQLDLTPYAGAWHVLRFEFDSESYLWARGWYLDDIQVTTTARAAASTNAPEVFSSSDFPSDPGEYYRAWRNTNGVLTAAAAVGGGAKTWDFSQSQQSGDFAVRMDAVPASDTGLGDSFPEATYAERITNEGNGDQSYSFYSLTNGLGRFYHGFYNPIDNPIDPLAPFIPPVKQFPLPVQFGNAWHWDTDFVTDYETIIEQVHLGCSASVDGYGIVKLPGYKVPSLRVKELLLETVSINSSDILSTTITNYYWLIRGVGLAVQITAPDTSLGETVQTLRVFEASDFEDLLQPVTNLTIHISNSIPVLSWDAVPGTNGYRVETSPSLSPADWRLSDLPFISSWKDGGPASEPQRFFRVFSRP